MSKPELDIIRSPSAETFLRTVTSGFYNHSYLSLWMFEVIGREWDEMAKWSDELKREIFVQTCTWSIAIWEWVYGFEPDESLTLEERRERILRKIRGVRPINPEVLRRAISEVAGAEAGVTDFTAPYTFAVTLNVTTQPIPMERVLQYIFQHKPAHLAVSVEVIFPEMESTLHVGGTVESQVSISIPRKPDVYDFRDTLHAGGNVGEIVSIGVREKPDHFDFRNTLKTGGNIGALASVPIPQKTDNLDFQNTLRTGGSLAQHTSQTVPWDTSLPSAPTILRTGGVCTIISNQPPRGE